MGFLKDGFITLQMILQLFTIKLNAELFFTVDVDLLEFRSSLTVLRDRDVLDHCPLLPRSSKVTLYITGSLRYFLLVALDLLID
jgi:hypothetical protein